MAVPLETQEKQSADLNFQFLEVECAAFAGGYRQFVEEAYFVIGQ